MLRHILEEQGHQVSVATDGRAALEMALELLPTLVISDVNMPQLSGYELCRQIKATPQLHDTPVILVTQLADPDDVLQGLKSGADSFVLKPYTREHMLEQVRHALSNQQPADPTGSGSEVKIFFHGEEHGISAGRAQILNLLMSTYEGAAQRNQELQKSQELLAARTAELLAANLFLDSMIEHIPTPIYIKDADNLHYVRVNRAEEELVGIPREKMIGKTAHEVFAKHEADLLVAQDRRVLAVGTVQEIPEHPLSFPGKGERLMHTRKIPLFGGSKATHILGISEDVTQRKQMEQKIRSLNAVLKARAEELEASNESLESFTAAATHDLRSPLGVIGGYAGLLESQYASRLDEKGLRYLSAIRSNIHNMSKLIEDLLDFSRLGYGEVSKADLDMQSLVHQVIDELLHGQAQDKKPKFEIGLLVPARADRALLRQVWINLISNAIKYSSKSTNPLIQISACHAGPDTVYTVRDNGAGFDMEHYDKLFEMFQRLHTGHEFHGTGVGLPIVHRIVTRHGGRVWAEGKVGEGAVFHFSLPA